jgi:1-deoxy-D-xylulose-5-phosphate synthase
VVDARFIKPIDPDIPTLAERHRAVLTIEDGTTIGGFGDAVLEALAEAGVAVPLQRLGLPDRFIEHGAQSLLLHKFSLDAEGVAEAARELLRIHRPSVLRGSFG